MGLYIPTSSEILAMKYLLRQNVMDIKVKIDVYDAKLDYVDYNYQNIETPRKSISKDIFNTLSDTEKKKWRKVLTYKYNYVDTIECGVISASINVDSSSDIRRTATLELIPMKSVRTIISEEGLIWLTRDIVLSVGLRNQRSGEYEWFKQGHFLITDTSSTYDATTNTLTLNLSDWMSRLDGTLNGNLGQQDIEYPAYEEYEYWYAGTQYSVGDNVAYYDSSSKTTSIYTCTTANSDNVWTSSHWSVIKSNVTTNVIKSYYISDQMITTVSQLGRIGNYEIGWIGERKAMPNYGVLYYVIDNSNTKQWFPLTNEGKTLATEYIVDKGLTDTNVYSGAWDYLTYRETTLLTTLDGNSYYQCFAMPYDLEFTSSTTVLGILAEMRDMYEGYECYFDLDNTFCCDLIPTGADEPTILTSDFFDNILISENVTDNFTEPKNVQEVWGESFDPDFYETTNITYSNNIYYAQISEYTDSEHSTYYNGDIVAIKAPQTNAINPYLNINSLGAIPIYNENYERGLEASVIEKGQIAVFKIKKRQDSSTKATVTIAYYLGVYQAHAIDVLTNGTLGDDYTDTTWSETVKQYSQRYYELIYNCNDVHMTVYEDSPFVVQKIGEVLEVYENDDVESMSTAIETARQENYRNYRLTDTVSITIKLCPFLDVNWKIKYKMAQKDEAKEYLISSISHDLSGGTTTLTLVSYYPTYTVTDHTT